MALIYIPCKDSKEARKISLHLLEKRLIACANIVPIRSMYRWKEKIVRDKEVLIIAKTTDKNYSEIKKEVKKVHSYELPSIIKISSISNKEYDAWVKKETK